MRHIHKQYGKAIAIAFVLLCVAGWLATSPRMHQLLRGNSGGFFATHYMEEGVRQMQRRNFDDAVKSFDSAVQADPTNQAAYSLRCLARTETKDFAGAIADGTKAIEFAPDAPDGWSNRAAAYLLSGDPENGLHDYEKAEALAHKHRQDATTISSLLAGQGAALRTKGDLKQAIEKCTEAIKLNPDCGPAYLNRGLALHLQRNQDTAQSDFKQWGRLMPSVKDTLPKQIANAEKQYESKR